MSDLILKSFDKYLEGGLVFSLISWLFIFLVTKIVLKILDKVFLNKGVTRENIFYRILRIFIIFIATYSSLSRFLFLRDILQTLLASSGVIALAASLAAQESISNLVAGVIILITKPYKIGDLIKIDNGAYIGYVEEITLRHTLIRTYEQNRIAIPNTTMNSKAIENYDLVDSKKSNFLQVTISYESDLDKAMKLLKELCDRHQDCMGDTSVKVTAFLDDGINLRATVISKDSLSGFSMLADIRHDIIIAFKENGIVIPYPTRTVYLNSQQDD